MEHTPIFLTKYALARTLKKFARSLGLSDAMADTVAQVHLQTDASVDSWSKFLSSNCASCLHEPSTCVFLNPQDFDRKVAVAGTIELGRFDVCPELKNDGTFPP